MVYMLEQGEIATSVTLNHYNEGHLHCTASTLLFPDHDKNERNEILPMNVFSSTLVLLSVIGAGITSS